MLMAESLALWSFSQGYLEIILICEKQRPIVLHDPQRIITPGNFCATITFIIDSLQ